MEANTLLQQVEDPVTLHAVPRNIGVMSVVHSSAIGLPILQLVQPYHVIGGCCFFGTTGERPDPT